MMRLCISGLGLAISAVLPSAFGEESPTVDQAVVTPLTTIPVAVAAQEVPVADDLSAKNRLMEEIVVTAQKREERLQDVPISIQAFSGEALAARGIETTADMGQAIPSLQFTGTAGEFKNQ